MTIKKGQHIIETRAFTQEEFNQFAALSGDDNPIHVDPEFAAQTHFGATVAHGMLLYTALTGMLDRHFPDYVQVEQEMMFSSATFIGEDVEFDLLVSEINSEAVKLTITLTRPDGEMGLVGTTRLVVKYPDYKPMLYQVDGASFKGLVVGQSARQTRKFTVYDLSMYQALSHTTRDYIAENRVPEPLIGGMFSDLLGTQLPGRGTGWLKQKFHFFQPAKLERSLFAEVEIVRLRIEKDLVNLKTVCLDEADATVCVGESLALVRNLEVFL